MPARLHGQLLHSGALGVAIVSFHRLIIKKCAVMADQQREWKALRASTKQEVRYPLPLLAMAGAARALGYKTSAVSDVALLVA